jgi:hypothetical protein
MREYVIYKGHTYFIQTSNRYYQNGNKDVTERLLHRAIWSDHYGAIPDGHIIHHKDHDWRNNNIENLELMELRKHLSDHAKELHSNSEYIKQNKESLLKAQESAKIWHASEEGLAWHKKHGKECWIDRKLHKVNCIVCKKEVETPFPTRTKYCSKSCRQKIDYQKHKTDKRNCCVCNKEFLANKYTKVMACSRKCGNNIRWMN